MVYLAWDEDRDQPVALKRLTRVGPEGLFRFKREFRLMADMNHPNLINLYELLTEGGQFAFTMEFVDGLPFAPWVRNQREVTVHEGTGAFGRGASESATLDGLVNWTSEPSDPAPGSHSMPSSALQTPERLHAALIQLVAGIQALHGAGILHLDLKSNNVLVSTEGRVVILDFGLSQEREESIGERPGETTLMGTPSHLAPEFAQGLPASEACDWYSVGVMLFECLTGRMPFLGSAVDMIRAKVERPAPNPRDLCPGLPAELANLCEALLQRDPALRPDGAGILAALGSAPAETERRRIRTTLVGRETELETLRLAQASTRGGHFRAALLHGASGLGKSFLIRRFLHDVEAAEPGAVTLVGRCFEQESVPFKGMDSLVDGLSHLLRRLPPAEVETLLPAQIKLLVQLFPVLRQVPAIASRVKGDDRPVSPEDAQDTRRRAFVALRELFTRLAEQRPVVLVLDDFHWADPDSVALVQELIRPPNAPGLMLLFSYRTEEAPSGPLGSFLEALQEAHIARAEVTLEPLSPELALTLARERVSDPAKAADIAQSAEGNPWLINELCLQDQGAPLASGPASPFHRLVLSRLAALPDYAQDILHLLAVAGYPLPWDTIRRTVDLKHWGADPISPLRNHHLARIRGTPRNRSLETFHDQVREAVLAALPAAEVRACHLRLARALEASPRTQDAQALANHCLAGGDPVRAAEYCAQAAQESEAALAFDRAADLYRKSIDLRPAGDPRLADLRARLGSALVNAGQSAAAAREFLAAAEASPAEAARFRRRAAEEFFRSGHVAEGLEIARTVLAGVGLRIPPSPLRAMASLIWNRFRLALRGLDSVERQPDELDPALLERIDVLWSLAMGLGPFDLVRATDFQTRHLLLALDAGEPTRLVRGLAHETALRSAVGRREAPMAQHLLSRTLAVAERLGNPEAMARAQLAASIAATAGGRWRAGLDWATRTQATLQQGCAGVNYEMHMAQFFGLRNAMLLGDFPEVAARFPGMLQEARRQGDLLTSTNLQVVIGAMLRLAEDQPEKAHQVLDQALDGWQHQGFLLQHMDGLANRCNILLHQGRDAEALAALERKWRPLAKSYLMDAEAVRVTVREVQVRVLLATGQDRKARRCARALARERCDYGQALAMKNLAVLAGRAGRRGEAAEQLFEAEMALEACELHLHAQSVRRVRGGLLGGKVGLDLLLQADAWMSSRAIHNPARMARMLVPGLDEV